MPEPQIALLDRRRIEAEMLAQVYETLIVDFDESAALAFIEKTLRRAAFAAGQAFAAKAPDGPCLKHFATVLDLWRGTGALDIQDVRLEDTTLRFDVTRCSYAQLYRDMDLPRPLAQTISCCRDEPFAMGYSRNIAFRRANTIASGGTVCDFLFTWKD